MISPLQQPTPPQTSKPSTEVGFTLSVRDFLVYSDGLPSVKINELVENEKGAIGFVNSLYEDRVQILMVDDENITPGEIFKKTGRNLAIGAGEFLIGRSINPMGVPIDGHGPLRKTGQVQNFDIDTLAVGIDKRKFIEEQFVTGIALIDILIPLGKGQRELVLGDARSGKNRFLTDIVTNQKGTGIICIYCMIGKPVTEVRTIIDELTKTGSLSHSVIIAASSTDPPPLVFLAPHTAMTVAEYFQRQGKDVLVILDDLGNHAKIHREISLLSDKPPGRESYPGDIFYQHSHLLERGGKFTPQVGGGSITVLPAIELNLNDFTTFIPTTVMSMTDGHLLFKSSLLNLGIYPSVDISLSVSRVGKQTQNRIENGISNKVKSILTQAESMETLKSFSAELPEETQVILRQKEIITELLKQEPKTYLPLNLQTVLLALAFTKFLKFKTVEAVKKNKIALIKALSEDAQFQDLLQKVPKFESDDQLIATLEQAAVRLEGLFKG